MGDAGTVGGSVTGRVRLPGLTIVSCWTKIIGKGHGKCSSQLYRAEQGKGWESIQERMTPAAFQKFCGFATDSSFDYVLKLISEITYAPSSQYLWREDSPA